MKPVRIQLSRKKGFNLQEHSRSINGLEAVNVARPTTFGNPAVCSRPHGCPHSPEFDRKNWEYEDGSISPFRCCVDCYRHYVETGVSGEPTRTGRLWFALEAEAGYPHRSKLIARLHVLRGKNLACWCAPKERCHADVLLELANKSPTP